MAREYRPGSLVITDVIGQTLAATRRKLIEVAHREHRKVITTEPRPGRWRQFVDGAEGVPFENVRANGVITIDYMRLDIVAQFAMETLFDLSPVDSGDYRNAHTLFLGDTAIASMNDWRPADASFSGFIAATLKDWEPGEELSIANFLAYSRKIEVGAMTMRVPGTDHVYEQAEQIVRRRYGNLADIRFTFRGVVDGALVSGKAGNNPDVRYPALVLNDGRSSNRRRASRR